MTLEERVKNLEAQLALLAKSDRYTFQRDIQMLDGRNIQVASGTGSIIATTATQKLGFFGAAPIAQPGEPTFPSGGATQDAEARGAINQIINKLSASSGGLGLWA